MPENGQGVEETERSIRTKNTIVLMDLNQLKGNPIFRMSLGAKELFHSNFLEYLWELNNKLFIEMMNKFIKPELPLDVEYKMGRELENFDICIYHYERAKKIVYDLIIENKVKSIPYKEQLKNYEKKAQQHSGCRFMLLTLSKEFPDNNGQALSNWVVIGYDDLLKGIRNLYLNSTNNRSGNDRCYIQDYCSFIEQLNELKDNMILPEQHINGRILFCNNDITELKEIRLHDLYIKMRSSWFLTKLKKNLENKGITPIVVHKYKEIHQNYKKKGVYLNVDMNQGNGQIAAWINDRDGGIGNTFEIVIQGDQYRHGISFRTVKTNTKGNERLNELYDKLQKKDHAFSFLKFGTRQDVDVKPDKPTNFRKSNLKKKGPFCCYDDGYIYRYINVASLKIDELLKKMTEDILHLSQNIPSI